MAQITELVSSPLVCSADARVNTVVI